MEHDNHNNNNNMSSSQDEISLFLHQILLRSSSSSMPGSINQLQDGKISALDSTSRPNHALNVSSSSVGGGGGGGLSGNDTDEYDCESEEGVEALIEEVPTKSVGTSRSSSKRSRAAEVHNLSEKRRRSRINEKMKALQNLIPNSNKTDKASMLDEAIEYLKQLQLQVQMLSLRNGLSLHPMYFHEGLHSLPLSRMSTELSEGNGSNPLNMTSTLPHPQDNPLLYASNLPNKNTLPSQPSMSSYPSYINNTETSFGVESGIPAQKKHLQRSSESMHGLDLLQHQQLNAINSFTNLLGGSQVVKEFQSGAMATPTTNNTLQTCVAGRDQSGVVMRNSEPNIIFTSQLSR